MRKRPLVFLTIGIALVAMVSAASATGPGTVHTSARSAAGGPAPEATGFRGSRPETLWIFWANFEDLEGDNAGWTVYDRSGTIAMQNHWHHDTIRIQTAFTWLGDSTWWCGTYSECWAQPRGYGNDWVQILKRSFPEIETNTNVGDPLFLDYDQRFAMEHDFDYGYTDVSTDGGDTWTSVHVVSNPGFAGKPGLSQDWDSVAHGHVTVPLPTHAGLTVDLRFRFESDMGYSSQDQYNNGPPNNSVQDGAWQIDNISWTGPAGVFWLDDSESGLMGWDNADQVAAGQEGVVYERGQFGIDFLTGRGFTCEDRPVGTWMMGAVDPVTSQMVDGQYSWLMSPPIDISGAPKLVAHWDQWCDMPRTSDDVCNLYLASDDLMECVTALDGFIDEDPGWWYADPQWYEEFDDWDAFAGNDWLAVLWAQMHDPPASGPSGGQHWAGLILNFQKVGIPSGGGGTVFEPDTWNWFNDWFQEDLAEAMLDSGRVKIKNDNGVNTALLLASNDGGLTWNSYNCHKESAESNWWVAPPPHNEMTPGSEIRYYLEATDGNGNVEVHPDRAPDAWYEMSILPITATGPNTGMLLVDKHGRRTPGEERDYRHSSQYYYREMLEILGYVYDVYDVEVPSGSTDQSDGPDTTGMAYYHTQIWFTNDFNAYTIKPVDQVNLIQWLSAAGVERNLLMTGNDIGFELMEAGKETLAFYETFLASHYLENTVGAVLIDSVPGLEDHAGDWDFMTHDDGYCLVRGGCPALNQFDVVEPFSGIAGTEIVADYVRADSERKPAGVAYTHATAGYQTVNLGFGMEFMMGSMLGSGHYETGLHDRLDLMQNIMDYFAITPTADGTGIVDGVARNTLAQAYPNPFNPVTKIAYSVKDAGRVTVRVYNAAGRTVRTLLDEEMAAGTNGHVVWDGRNGHGERCGSGVYFYRIEAPGFAASRKMVMLK